MTNPDAALVREEAVKLQRTGYPARAAVLYAVADRLEAGLNREALRKLNDEAQVLGVYDGGPSREAYEQLRVAVDSMRQYCDETRVTHICPEGACGQCAINAALDRCEAEAKGGKGGE